MQVFEHEALVYIWRLSFGRTGHAALKLKSPRLHNASNGKNQCYVSWWPNGAGKVTGWRTGQAHRTYQQDRREELKPETREALAGNRFQPRGLQKFAGSFQGPQSDPNGWGQSAESKVRLPGLGSQGVVFGLDLGAMVRWWNLFESQSAGFHILQLNCSRVVAMCLLAGGAGRVCKPPVRALNLWTPNVVDSWAQRLEAIYAARNKAMAELDVVSLPRSDRPVPNLLEPAVWKKETTLGVFSTRREQVLKIDKLLQHYAVVSHARDEKNLEFALGVLSDILGLVHEHVIKKGDVSKNREAVALLGQQALKAYRERSGWLADLKTQRASGMGGGAAKFKLLDEVNALMSDAGKLGQESWGL